MSREGGQSGTVLTVGSTDEIAVEVKSMWDKFNMASQEALSESEEAREYIYAIDIDKTSGVIMNHKNRTHQPKLGDIASRLKSKIWNATLSRPDWFTFTTEPGEDPEKARNLELLVRAKLEQRKFRTTTGRQLLDYFIDFGNTFTSVDYITQKDDLGRTIYRGPTARAHDVFDIVMRPEADSFQETQTITRRYVHKGTIKNWPSEFPNDKFDEAKINEAIELRGGGIVGDWVKWLEDQGITLDGFNNSWEEYFKQDLVEVLIYRGDIYDPETQQLQKNRIIYVIDGMFLIRNEPAIHPLFDGLHHAGAKTRSNNLWATSPIAPLVGMQYRIDHLENLKADIADLMANPPILKKGIDIMEPEQGYAPGAEYEMGLDSDVSFLIPPHQALQIDAQIDVYHKLMDEFAGLPPEARGFRSPGEKTTFEVDTLISNGSEPFLTMANNFERMLETMLEEMAFLVLTNFDKEEKISVFDDLLNEDRVITLSAEDINVRGRFIATGAKHWEDNRRQAVEIQQFQQLLTTFPELKGHIVKFKYLKHLEVLLKWEDTGIFEENGGVKEDVNMQIVAEEEAKKATEANTEQTTASTLEEVLQGQDEFRATEDITNSF